MAQPRTYTRQYNFTDFQTASPSAPLPAVQVDAELNTAKLTLDDLNTNIGLIQRDDGKLRNNSVHTEAFDATSLALMNAGEISPKGSWAASTTYAANDLVNYNASTYLCLIAHTSTPNFLTDAASGKWNLLANAAIGSTAAAVDKFEGNGTLVTFTLTYTYTSNTDVLVFVNGALRNPGDDYTVTGNQITFVTAPSAPSVAGNENVIVWGPSVATQAAKDAAEAALDAFDDRYLGAKSTAPTVDNDGNALVTGSLYFDTVSNVLFNWTGSAWSSIKPTAAQQTAIDTIITNIATVNTVAGDLNSGSFNAGTEYDFGLITAASSGQSGSPNGFIVSVHNKLNEITNVSNNLTTIQAVNAASANTSTVAGIASDVTTVAGLSTEIGVLNGISSDITAVSSNSTNINALNAISSDITAVSAVSTPVSTVASNITAVQNTSAAATNINNVSGSLSNINSLAGLSTEIGVLNGISSDITAVSGNSANITTLSGQSANLTALGSISSDITTVSGMQSNVASVVGNQTNINAAVGLSSEITSVSGLSSQITTVAGDTAAITALSAISGDVTSLANAIGSATTYVVTVSGGVFVIDGAANPSLTLDRGNTYIFDLSDSSNASHPLIIKDSSGNVYSVGVTSTGTAGSANAKVEFEVASNAPSSLVYACQTHGNSMGNSITVVNSNLSLVASNITQINSVGSNIANINSVGSSISNVDSVANNLASVNSFGETYRIGSAEPTSSLDTGDLFYNTTSNVLKVYNGSAWEAGVTAGGGFLPLTGGTMTGTLNVTTVDFGDWTITESGGSLYFATSGTNKMKLDASGNLDVAGSVNANATIT